MHKSKFNVGDKVRINVPMCSLPTGEIVTVCTKKELYGAWGYTVQDKDGRKYSALLNEKYLVLAETGMLARLKAVIREKLS